MKRRGQKPKDIVIRAEHTGAVRQQHTKHDGRKKQQKNKQINGGSTEKHEASEGDSTVKPKLSSVQRGSDQNVTAHSSFNSLRTLTSCLRLSDFLSEALSSELTGFY